MIEGLIERNMAFISKTPVVHSEQVFASAMTEYFFSSLDSVAATPCTSWRHGSADVD